MSFDNYLFHPSSLGQIMTDAKDKKEILGETCKEHLLQCWIEKTYGRKKDISSKYFEKGIVQEEESITLYSLVTKKFYKKNAETISNEFFVGTPDLYEGDGIKTATLIIDIKTSWDIFSFFKNIKKYNKNYYWQMQAYMDLSGAQSAKLVYCLVNTPENLIEDEKRRLSWAMNLIDPDINPEYIAKCYQIEKNSRYDDIPKDERYLEFDIPRNQEDIDKAHARVVECRDYLNAFKK